MLERPGAHGRGGSHEQGAVADDRAAAADVHAIAVDTHVDAARAVDPVALL